MSRRQRIDSAKAAVAVVTAAAKPLNPPAGVKLTKAQLVYWEPIIAARPRSEWNEADLITAAQLAKTMAMIEALAPHDVAAFDKLGRLSLAMRRSLGLDVRGKDGRASNIANRRAHAFEIEANGLEDDDLLARPTAVLN